MIKLALQVSRQTWNAYERHRFNWNTCAKCPIRAIAARHVFPKSKIPCDVLVIGEAPGQTENILGLPFVGQSGKLLEDWLQPYSALAFCITNTVLCRPCDKANGPNRSPTQTEIINCKPRLDELIKLAKPKVAMLVGKVAWSVNLVCPSLHIYHPAYILRNGGKGTPLDKTVRDSIHVFLERNKLI